MKPLREGQRVYIRHDTAFVETTVVIVMADDLLIVSMPNAAFGSTARWDYEIVRPESIDADFESAKVRRCAAAFSFAEATVPATAWLGVVSQHPEHAFANAKIAVKLKPLEDAIEAYKIAEERYLLLRDYIAWRDARKSS